MLCCCGVPAFPTYFLSLLPFIAKMFASFPSVASVASVVSAAPSVDNFTQCAQVTTPDGVWEICWDHVHACAVAYLDCEGPFYMFLPVTNYEGGTYLVKRLYCTLCTQIRVTTLPCLMWWTHWDMLPRSISYNWIGLRNPVEVGHCWTARM